ncbi:UDP-glucose 4-epimerase GalE [Curtobacterium flaccumfaciens pv. oortii]|uniref:UDP-glucose 4-epimerase GalE n=1 Tax=Curtobacterium flaccumfaciens TaxID=2035 RepID=UPI001BDEFFFB|nr:UDP-glucose 4-epimerase GalE [Curtobacterium flaccumfaciens]MBT1624266.1 UDP-glucose 4-epimerase GalE [Curtobacterium flaccumfaciens pv. oortii]
MTTRGNDCPKTVLVTGGAGYIGSHVARVLRSRGDRVIVVDDLSTGSPRRLDAPLEVQLDLAAPEAVDVLRRSLSRHGVTDVVHLAAMKQVGESMQRPTHYFDRNVGGLVHLLSAMEHAGVDRLVFSSSAAVYGQTTAPLVDEDHPCAPSNPYGQSKLVGEWMTENAARAWGLRAANLRYFNVAGTGWPELADDGIANLIPIVLRAALRGEPVPVFGTDLATPDGTCVRDFVHVHDLALAHVAALDHVAAEPGVGAFNIGTGSGTSVRQVVDIARVVTGIDIAVRESPARAGDPQIVVADPSRANRVLGWSASRSADGAIRSAWAPMASAVARVMERQVA